MMLPRDQSAPYKLIQEYLKGERLTVHEIKAKLGISIASTNRYLLLLRKNGVIRIAEYSRLSPGKGGCHTPLYTLGKWDTRRPEPLTSCVTTARSREKHRAAINAEKRAIREKESGVEVPQFTKMLRSLGLL